MTLADYLARAARMPFAWGRHDCCLWVADWLVARGRPDPAAAWRGRYRTPLGAARVLTRLGGVIGAAHALGLEPTDRAICGDVGVVAVIGLDGRRAEAGAICTGRRWATLTAAGLLIAETTPRAAWRI